VDAYTAACTAAAVAQEGGGEQAHGSDGGDEGDVAVALYHDDVHTRSEYEHVGTALTDMGVG
jgi:hypothetical protein